MTSPRVLPDGSRMATDKAGIERGTGTESDAKDESENAKRTAHESHSTADAGVPHSKRVHGDTLEHATVDS